MICPMQGKLRHKVSCHLNDSLDFSLCSWIMMMCSNSRERLLLIFLSQYTRNLSDTKIPFSLWMCGISTHAFSQSHCLKRFLPKTVSLAPKYSWFSTQIITVSASLQRVSPWNIEEEDSCPYPVVNWPGVSTTNWYTYNKYPGLYLSRYRMPYFSGTTVCFLVTMIFF